jgi:hypothetical protein
MSGISQHSTKKNLMIFSVFNKENSVNANHDLHNSMINQLKNNNKTFKEVYGVYKNQQELSFVVDYNFNLMYTLLTEYNQESVLLLTNHKHGLYKATLIYKSKKEDIGYFRQVPKKVAIKQDSYTVDGDNYYICTESDATTADELTNLGLK